MEGCLEEQMQLPRQRGLHVGDNGQVAYGACGHASCGVCRVCPVQPVDAHGREPEDAEGAEEHPVEVSKHGSPVLDLSIPKS